MWMLAVQNALESRRNTVRRNACAGTHVLARQRQEVVALFRIETKGFGQRIEHMVGDPDVPGLLQACVPASTDAGQIGDILSPKAGSAP